MTVEGRFGRGFLERLAKSFSLWLRAEETRPKAEQRRWFYGKGKKISRQASHF